MLIDQFLHTLPPSCDRVAEQAGGGGGLGLGSLPEEVSCVQSRQRERGVGAGSGY